MAPPGAGRVRYKQSVCNLHTDCTIAGVATSMARSKHDLRSEATRQALVRAARSLFGARGYADVGTEEIVRAAGVTRGALYHQFHDKAGLFAAVAEEVEAEITGRIAAGAAGGTSPALGVASGRAPAFPLGRAGAPGGPGNPLLPPAGGGPGRRRGVFVPPRPWRLLPPA